MKILEDFYEKYESDFGETLKSISTSFLAKERKYQKLYEAGNEIDLSERLVADRRIEEHFSRLKKVIQRMLHEDLD